MNLGYIEKGDKILVIDQNGNDTEREHTNNIEKILNYENRIEILDNVIRKYEEELENFSSKSAKIFLLFKLLIFITTLCIFCFGLPVWTVVGLYITTRVANYIWKKCAKKNLDNQSKQQHIINNIKNDKYNLERSLEKEKKDSKIMEKTITQNGKIISLKNDIENYENKTEDRIACLNNKVNNINKTKTLKKVRK